jgi:hypothetical protein
MKLGKSTLDIQVFANICMTSINKDRIHNFL